MNARQRAFLHMCRGLSATCEAHRSSWQFFAAFADAYAGFLLLLGQAREASDKQATTFGSNKGRYRLALGQRLLKLSQATVMYAQLNNLPNLKADAHITASGLRSMSGEKLMGRCTLQLGLAAGLDLGALGIGPSFLEETEAACQAFANEINTPRHRRAEAAEGSRQLRLVIGELRKCLTQLMDPAAALLGSGSQPDFAATYRIARRITDPSYRRRALRVVIRDEETGEPLEGVQAVITPGPLQKTTTEKGGFYVRRLEAGQYLLKISGPGYAEKEASFYVRDREATSLELKLERQAGEMRRRI